MRTLLIPTSDWLCHPFPQRLNHIFERIANNNEVHVIRFKLYKGKERDTNLIVHEINDHKVENLALYYFINSGILFKMIKELTSTYNFDNVVISNLLAGYITTKAVRPDIPIIFDLSDHFPSIGAGFYLKPQSSLGSIAEAFLEEILIKTLNNVKLTITCSDKLINYCRSRKINNVKKVTNGVSEIFFKKTTKSKNIKKIYDLSDKLVIGYLGSIEFWLELAPLLKAVKILRKKYNIKFLLIGNKLQSKKLNNICNKIKRLGIEENILWLDFIPYNEVPVYIDCMDICTIPFNLKYPTVYYSTPNKLLEYFARGKPVISSRIPEFINRYKNLIEFAETPAEYIKAINKIVKEDLQENNNSELRINIAKNFTWDNLANKYESYLCAHNM